ncbi:HAD family hydrolase [Eubacterium ramulus]|uniref:HAD family hydrolase n=1 Tax=Eubacterium ramulus TaxID=39490 RepID=UPI003520C21E
MTSHLTIPALAIFDMDGLIFDTERLFMTTKDGVMKEYGYTQQKDDYIHTLGTCGQQLLDILHRLYGDDYPAEEISQKCRTLVTEKIRRDGPPVKPGIPELLAWFASNNIPCCVASSTKHDIVVEYLRLAKLDKNFAFVIGGDQVQRCKPNPDIFLAACQRTDIKPEHALVLEDSENGILAASNANIPVVCIPDLKVPSEEIAKKTAAIVPDATAIISLFG